MLRSSRSTGRAQVQSFLVQAGIPAERVERTRGQILVRHLLSRFQTQSTEEDEQAGRKTLFASAAAAIPPVFVSVMLYPAYHPIAMPPAYRPYWSQVGDDYLYLLYAFVTLAIAAIVLWESIFPDLLDVIALGTLPLTPRLLLQARWKALAFSVGMVLLCVTAPGTLLLPAVAENAHLFRHFAAHGIATCAAGLSAFCSLLAVQAFLEITLGTRRAKQVMPVLQVGVILALFFLLGYTPHVLQNLQQGSLDARVPPMWFLGMYERMKGGGPSARWGALAWRGWLILALSTGAASATYSRAYRRRTLYLAESGNAAVPGMRVSRWMLRVLHRTWIRTAKERATFHLIAQTAFRIPKLRTTFAIYVGAGIAAVLATSIHAPARAVAIVCCVVITGCIGMLRTRIMPRSAWLVQVLPRPNDTLYFSGCRMLVTLWTASLTILTLVLLVLGFHAEVPSLRVVFVALSTVLVLPPALTGLSMLQVRAFPFTDEQEATPESFVLGFVRNVFLIPVSLFLFGVIAVRAASTAGSVTLWLAAMCGIALASWTFGRNGRSPDPNRHATGDGV